MKLGPVELNPIGFLHEPIMNTRLLILAALLVMIQVPLCALMYISARGIVISESVTQIMITVISSLVGFVGVAITFYYKSRETGDATRASAVEHEIDGATNVPQITEDKAVPGGES